MNQKAEENRSHSKNNLMLFPQQEKELSTTLGNLKIDIQTKEIIHEHSHNSKDDMGYVHNIFLTKDGKYLATGNRDKIPKLWNLQTGKCFRIFKGHTRRAGDVSVSSDNKYLASSSWDGTARLWDIQKEKCLKIFKDNENGFRGCCLSADGTYLVTVGFEQNAKLWDTSSGRCIRIYEGHKNWLRSCYISNCGKYIATASGDGTARLWHVDTGRCIRTFDAYGRVVQNYDWFDGVLSVHMNKDNTILATASSNGKVQTWDVATGRCTRTFEGHEYKVWSVFLSSNGKHLVSGSSDNSAKLLDMTKGEYIRAYEGHLSTVESTFLSEDSNLLVTGGHDNTVRFWKTFSGEQLAGFYDLKDGFLWFTPPDEAAKSGWFWTDRPELIRVMKCNADGSEKEILADDAPDRVAYINTYNRQDMVMNRLNNYKQYKKDMERMIYHSKTHNLINQGRHQYRLPISV